MKIQLHWKKTTMACKCSKARKCFKSKSLSSLKPQRDIHAISRYPWILSSKITNRYRTIQYSWHSDLSRIELKLKLHLFYFLFLRSTHIGLATNAAARFLGWANLEYSHICKENAISLYFKVVIFSWEALLFLRVFSLECQMMQITWRIKLFREGLHCVL